VRAITIAILAMGGEGGGVLADWIVDVAEHAGYWAQATSVPGVAQRTGTTIYYVEVMKDEGREPVLALMPVPGEVDIVIASELMETGRAIQRGLVTPDRTTLIASSHRVYSMTERTAMGDGRVDSEALLEAARSAAKRLVVSDFAALAQGSVISASLFGALAATDELPFTRQQFEDAIRRGDVGVDASLRAFAAGWGATPVVALPSRDREGADPAIARLTDYQDARYAAEYEALCKGLMPEAARYLALWMSYEDAIRVADLKIRAARFQRVREEVRAAPGQVVRIHEYLHPGLKEIADIVPPALGRWLLRRKWAGQAKIVETTSIFGFLQLYLLAKLRPFRRRSMRFQREHARIREWLELLHAIAAEDEALAREWAECPRVLKGYGETYERGSQSYQKLLEALPRLRRMKDGAERLKKLREAALADDTGDALKRALQEIPA